MKRYLLILFIAVTAFSACKKEKEFDAAAQAVKDDADIQAYIKANSLTDVQKDASGLYYKILTPGTGAYPTVSSTVTVNYSGKLLDGTSFDSRSGITFPLSGVIQGWQIGIPKINNGGRILLLVPSALGYANKAQSGIPANSVLVFTVDLQGFR